MKRVCLFVIVFVLLLCSVPVALADEVTAEIPVTYDVETDSYTPLEDASSTEGESLETDTSSQNTELVESIDTEGTTQVNVFAVTNDDATGGSWIDGGSGDSLIETLFGAYTPYNADGIASVDWAWVADVALFAIVVVCFFKIVGGVIKRG